MNTFDNADWQRLLPDLKAACPRLTPADLAESQQRIDLLAAKIQNRHWVSRTEAKHTILTLCNRLGIIKVA